MPTRYGRSPWIDQFPKSRVPSYPQHRGPLKVDAVIVGGGLTGCATAYAFAAAGVKVALFEADRLGHGASGASTGWLADDPGVSLFDLEQRIGLRAAKHVWQAWRRSALDFAALLRRLNIKCDLEPRGALLIATTPEQTARLTREQKSRRAAGFDAGLVAARAIGEETAVAGSTGIRSRDGATIDPYRATLGLAAAAVERGAQIFERSPVRRIGFNRKDAEVFTAAGTFRTHQVVVATAMPTTMLFRSLARHFWFKSSYLALTEPIPAKLRSRLGKRSVIIRDTSTPSHVIRWVDDDRLLIEGADGDRPPDRLRDKTVVQRTGQLMYELSTIYPDISGIMPAYGWDAPYALTAEGLPYIGPHRNFPHQLLAFGDSSDGVTGAFLASRLLLRHYLDEVDPADEAFGFTR
jgi:glycine/D-amino acid oxidase-like deaminating enzyme